MEDGIDVDGLYDLGNGVMYLTKDRLEKLLSGDYIEPVSGDEARLLLKSEGLVYRMGPTGITVAYVLADQNNLN